MAFIVTDHQVNYEGVPAHHRLSYQSHAVD